MPTNTPRLLLVKPLTSEAYDVGVANGNMDIVDAAPANVTICTSVTRPSTPDEGDLIFETDTLSILVRQGSTWKLMVSRVPLYTSGTRPASAQAGGGIPIFETDTQRLLVRNSANTAWLHVSPSWVSALSDITSPVDNQVALSGANRAWWFRDPVFDEWTPVAGGLVQACYPDDGSALTGAVFNETNVDPLDFVDVTLINGHLYQFEYTLNLGTSNPGDVFGINLRKGSPLTGTLLGFKRYCAPTSGNFSPTAVIKFYYPATANEINADFRMSIARSAGSGTIQVYQDADMRNFSEMYDKGVPGQGILRIT